MPKKHKKRTKIKIKEKQRGSANSNNKGHYICNYKRFETANAAALRFKIQASTVLRRCKSNSKKFDGWYFVPKQPKEAV